MDEGVLKKCTVLTETENQTNPRTMYASTQTLMPHNFSMLMLVYDMFITWATGCMCNTSRLQSTLKPKFDYSVAPNNAMTPRTVLMVNGS